MTADPGLVAAVEAERAAVAAAAVMAEDALSLQREALAVLAEGWDGQSGSAAADLMSRQCADGADVVAALQEVAGELALLRDSLADPGAPAAQAAGAYGQVPDNAGVPAATGPWASTGMPLPALPDFGGALAGLVGQIAEAIGVPVNDVALMAARLSGPDASLNAPVSEGEGGADRMDFLVSDAPLPDETVAAEIDGERRLAWLRQAMSVLSEREARILRERRLDDDGGATLEAIGERLGISKERVRQIETRAMEKLKVALLRDHPEMAGA